MGSQRLGWLLVLGFLVIIAVGGCQDGGLTSTAAPTSTTIAAVGAAESDTQVPSQSTANASEPAATPAPVSTSTSVPTLMPSPSAPSTASPTPLLSQTSTPQPTAILTPVAGPGPAIHYFRSGVQEAGPGDTINLEWSSEGGGSAVLYHLPPSGQLPANGWDVDTTGTFSYSIKAEERNKSEFLLVVTDDAGRHADAYLMVKLRCPDPWFFTPEPDICPTEPIVSASAQQRFERGTMVWVEEEDRIYVMYEDDRHSPKWDAFVDEWDEGEPDHDPDVMPPPGRFQPVRGFGLVWRQSPDVRDRLGWATEEEGAYTTTVQRTTLYKYNSTYIQGREGRVWHLGPERSTWEVMP